MRPQPPNRFCKNSSRAFPEGVGMGSEQGLSGAALQPKRSWTKTATSS